MSTLRQLLEQRTSLTESMRAIHAPFEGKALPEPEQRQFDALRAELEPLTAAIDRTALIDELDRRSSGIPLDSGGDAGFEKLAAKVTVSDVLRAQLPGVTDTAAGRAREVSAELARRSGRQPEGLFFDMRLSAVRRPVEQRVYTTTLPAGGPGSALIQTDVGPSLIDILRAKTIVRQLGATVLAGLTGNLSIPRLKASATAYWVAENVALTPSDPMTEGVPLSPKHVGGYVEVSRNMLMQPSLDVTQMIENDLAQIIARAFDSVAVVGGGADQPSGLLATGSGITSIALGVNGAAPTWDAVIALIAAVDTANALGGSLAFATNAKVVSKQRRTLRNTADTASTFIQEGPAQLAGYPLASSQLVPSNLTKGTAAGTCSAEIFGDWSQLVLGFWSELDLALNPFSDSVFPKGNLLIRAMATGDVAIKQPLAFAAITDMLTT